MQYCRILINQENGTINKLSNIMKILKRCNNVFVLKDTFSPYCIQKLNQYLVEHSDCALAIWNGTNRGASKTIKYALSKKIACNSYTPFYFLRSKSMILQIKSFYSLPYYPSNIKNRYAKHLVLPLLNFFTEDKNL